MTKLEWVPVEALSLERLGPLVGAERAAELDRTAASARDLLSGRRVINVNSTAKGGGVAELLQTLLAYARGAGIDAQWTAIDADPAFFTITKRIHNLLYGGPGDGGALGPDEHAHYERVLRANADELVAVIRPEDVVVLHDPQTAGLVPLLLRTGAPIVWRCHVGRDDPNEHTERAWAFLRDYLPDADGFVFTRAAFAPPWVPRERLHVIPPSIDPFAAKNIDLGPNGPADILRYVGLIGGGGRPPRTAFVRRDGSPGRVDRRVDILQTGPPPTAEVPLVVQLSRWDPMKDMAGVMDAFAHHIDGAVDAHLALVGPAVHGVADDPEAATVLERCIEDWRALPHAARSRVHLACVPMQDPDEAAVIVNALQRHATVVVQKSLAEGFGLTVVEAMWKYRAVVASKVGGIADQVVNERDGLLVNDPTDLPGFAAAVDRVLTDGALRARLGKAAHERARQDFLGDRHLEMYARLFATIVS